MILELEMREIGNLAKKQQNNKRLQNTGEEKFVSAHDDLLEVALAVDSDDDDDLDDDDGRGRW